MFRCRSACVAIGALFVAAGPALAQSPEEIGKAIAEEHCSRCHVVDPQKPFTGISSTPSFQLLVAAFPDWEERFETFYVRRPHPAVVRFEGIAPVSEEPPAVRTVDLKLSDVDAIVAYAASLKEAAEQAD